MTHTPQIGLPDHAPDRSAAVGIGAFPKLLAALAVMILVASLAYPYGYDQSVFSVGAGMILKQHAIPYRDLLDTKPPLVFYTYALARLLFGEGMLAIRAFDAILSLACAFYLYCIVGRVASRRMALHSASLFVITGTLLGFWHTAQAEGFAVLPSLATLDLLWRLSSGDGRRPMMKGLAVGLLTVIIALFKFTLVIGPVAGVLYVLMHRRGSADALGQPRLKQWFAFGVALGLAAAAVVVVVAMAQADALQRAVEAVQWTARYATITARSTGASFAERLFWLMPKSLVYHATPTITVLATAGCLIHRKVKDGPESTLYSLLIVTGLVQLIGIVIEGKVVFGYQYARLLWAFMPLAALGLERSVAFAISIRARLAGGAPAARWRGAGRLTLTAILGVGLSPLPRVLTQSLPFVMLAARGESPAAEIQRRIPTYFALEQEQVSKYLTRKLTPSDRLFFWGNDVGVYQLTHRLPPTICLTATPLRTAWTPPQWRAQMIQQLRASDPAAVVLEFGDAVDYITGSMSDSYEAMTSWPEFEAFVQSRYHRDTVIGHFVIIRRIGAGTVKEH